jgi:tRNA modification GTPase
MHGGTETICAVATPPGQGGVGIVRASGPASAALARAVAGRLPVPRVATFASFRDEAGELLDQGLILYFPAPHSFTGEDVLELHGHGGPVVMERLLRRLTGLGARLARPGEFSERAFLNGKLDLTQAEAVADLIAASTEAGARAAVRSLQGEFSAEVSALAQALIEMRTYVEAAIDFPEEEVDFLSDGEVERRLALAVGDLETLVQSARQGQVLRDGMSVAIAGRPNAGKSSLLNRLAGYEAAIVADVAGTTRDVLREHIQIDGMPLHIIDTAGLRESRDQVEQEGVRRAWAAMERADRVLLVVDDRRGPGAAERAIIERLPAGVGVTLVRNKIDLSGRAPGVGKGEWGEEVALSATTGAGLAELRAHLTGCAGYHAGEAGFTARRRHLEALGRAARHLEAGRAQLLETAAGELLAEELRHAHEALGEITGRFTSDDLLGRIFSSFCIGK